VIIINKKGLQLSINFIVWLIIALVVFGMGVTLFGKFFIEAENIKENLDIQTQKELQARMMSSPEPVVVYPTQLTIRRGKSDVFGVGILNLKANNNFEVRTYFGTDPAHTDGPLCYKKDGSRMVPPDCVDGIIRVLSKTDFIKRTIEQNEREIIDVPVRVENGVSAGKYGVKVVVVNNPGASEVIISKNLVYINVP
jgi:hypothetical protein